MTEHSRDWWPQWRRLLFRWWFAFFLLFALPFPLDSLSERLTFAWWYEAQTAVAVWVGHHLLGLGDFPVTMQTGSGDTIVGWLRALTLVLLAAIIAAVWSLADRRATAYPRLHAALRVYVRYQLFAILISYGFAKIFPTQFPTPSLLRLTTQVGEMSPMGLLWTFMGYSIPYNIFAGVLEAGAGILLLSRKTTLLGALLAMGVMGNIVMLNLAYDVPVKLFSMQLWIFAAWLALPDAGRLVKVFLLNQPAPAADLSPVVSAPWYRWARPAGKLVAVWLLWLNVHGGITTYPDSRREMTKTGMLYGIWNVSSYAVNGTPLPPPMSGQAWRRFGVDPWYGRGRLRLESDSQFTVIVDTDSLLATIGVYPLDSLFHRDSTAAALLHLVERRGDSLALAGTYLGDSISMTLSPASQGRFQLMTRGFRWVQEYPFNR